MTKSSWETRIVDIDGAIEAETARAVLFHTGDKSEAVWLARSQIEIEETGIGGIVTVSLPEWLADDRGLT
jgi:hypothetical protein